LIGSLLETISMSFKILPIELDVQGRARLRGGHADPFSLRGDKRELIAQEREKALAELAQRPNVREFDVEPVTRVAGALGLHTVVDFEQRRVLDARVEAPMFRGYELILRHRPPTETLHIASRVCGSCGSAHMLAATLALEMAFEIAPPPLAVVTRNLGACADLIYNHLRHLFVLAGPDYSAAVVKHTAPTLWERATHTLAPHSDIHECSTMAELMEALNPMGQLYLEALRIGRAAREVATFTLGKSPHPSAIYPGGVGITPDRETFNQVLGRIHQLLNYARKAVAVWDDLTEFFFDANPQYRRAGELPANLISGGLGDDPEHYDGLHARCNEWGERRLSTPGAIINGELRTTRLNGLNLGIEEFIEHAYYQPWNAQHSTPDLNGAPLSPAHPWNKETIPDPAPRNWAEQYTWATAPRWDREVMETGPLAAQWLSARGGKLKHEFIYAVRDGLEIELPKFERPATRLHWRVPSRPNALERNRARAYHLAYCGMTAFASLLKAFEYLQKGETHMSTPYRVPQEAYGVGFGESGQGLLTHHVVIKGGQIANYQIISPSTWMASPRDAFGIPGPYEAALINTPLLEECHDSADFTGIDMLRTIRSFDPCMYCTVH
jgi:hydrogenase large subunit